MTLPPDLVQRFGEDLARFWPRGTRGAARLGIAVSGGPDSLALLLLAAEALPGRLAAATVDHGLRAGSAAEAAMVARVCAGRTIPHTTVRVAVANGNVQAEARAARYVALTGWARREGLAAIATAHHADDQAETLLMRLNRGSGLAGLSGIRARTRMEGVEVVRPLLGWRKTELQQVCDATGIEAAQDASNTDPRFDRVAIRQMLATTPLLDPSAIASSAAHLADAEDALADWLEERWAADITQVGDDLLYRPHGPRYLRLRLLERAVASFGGSPRGARVAALLDRLEAGAGGNVAGVQVSVEGGYWLLRREAPRRS